MDIWIFGDLGTKNVGVQKSNKNMHTCIIWEASPRMSESSRIWAHSAMKFKSYYNNKGKLKLNTKALTERFSSTELIYKRLKYVPN